MTYSDTGFEITLTNNTLVFSGKLERSDYTEIDDFLRKVDQAITESSCSIDLTKMIFLNSSGIRSLATFILGSPKSFEIQINKESTWQTESIPVLQHLKSKGITIIS